jgi:hypothetical protein
MLTLALLTMVACTVPAPGPVAPAPQQKAMLPTRLRNPKPKEVNRKGRRAAKARNRKV